VPRKRTEGSGLYQKTFLIAVETIPSRSQYSAPSRASDLSHCSEKGTIITRGLHQRSKSKPLEKAREKGVSWKGGGEVLDSPAPPLHLKYQFASVGKTNSVYLLSRLGVRTTALLSSRPRRQGEGHGGGKNSFI